MSFFPSHRFQYITNPVQLSTGNINPINAHKHCTPTPHSDPKCSGCINHSSQSPAVFFSP